MFKDKKARKDVEALRDYLDNFVECSVCGCLVNRKKAKKEQKLVSKSYRLALSFFGMPPLTPVISEEEPDKEIRTEWYCSHCQPKEKKSKK